MVRHRRVLRKRGNSRPSAGPGMVMTQANQRVAARVEQVERTNDTFFEARSSAGQSAALDLRKFAGELDRADRAAAAFEPVRLAGELTRLGGARPRAHALEARAGVCCESLEKMRQQAGSRTDFEKPQLPHHFHVQERLPS